MQQRVRTSPNYNASLNYNLNDGSPGHTHRIDKYVRYLDGNVEKTVKSSSAPRVTVYTTASNAERIVDYYYTSAEKAALKQKKKWFRSCKEVSHVKTTFKTFGFNQLRVPMGLVNNTFREVSLTFTGLPADARTRWGFSSPIPGITIYNSGYRPPRALYESCFQRMLKDSSLLNLHDQNLFTTIGELKDFKQTVNTVTKHVLSDKRYIADKYLGVNFGIIPFYQDMKKYIENFNNFSPNLKKWNDLGRKGKILNKHGTMIKKDETKSVEVLDYPLNWPTGLHTYRYKYVYTSKLKIRGKCSTYFRAKPLESFYDNARLFASINGLSKPFTAAWNLIPFSFLVDWFVNVGDQIDAFEYHRPVARFDLVDACVSIKINQQLTCEVYLIDSTNGAETYLGRSEKTFEFYHRFPYSTDFLAALINGQGVRSPLEFKTELSGYQWSLAAALAVTNFPRKK